jgi:hypothetical protein
VVAVKKEKLMCYTGVASSKLDFVHFLLGSEAYSMAQRA